MADLPETAVWDAAIRQIETTDPVVGGTPNIATGAGMANIPHQQLARRTLWLKAALEDIDVDATTAQRGLIQLATSAEAAAGTVTDKALTPATAASAFGAAAPPGLIGFFARSAAPTGWLKANGAALSRSAYAALFNAIGTTFGAGDGSTTFNLPDLRGEFLRGLDDGRGVDAGRALGSAQSWAIENILGEFNPNGLRTDMPNGTGGVFAADGVNYGHRESGDNNFGGRISFDASRVVQTADETRPRNVALLACIKF